MYCYIAFIMIGIAHSLFVIFFAFQEDIFVSQGQSYDNDQLK